ncbi:uncharacterized protein LOC127705648 [Mytilus californianus]|uniref:uncharacterized protein LOC127705648 n=1 Tax=Mytilus californianus TaxID=6549 RepID=UPI0022457CEC|nr:uncharacterized protein LOC127705648 [Mytilus californianus]
MVETLSGMISALETQVCSDHFPGGRCKIWCHKVPTLFLPQKMTPDSKHRKFANSNKDRFWFSSLGIEDGNETMEVTNTDPGIFENDIHSEDFKFYSKTNVPDIDSASELHISEVGKDFRKEENLSNDCNSNDQNRGRISNDVLMVEESPPHENTELSSHTSISESMQVCRPEITIEDIRDSTDQDLFYTGLVNYNTFFALYESLLKIGADRMDVENGTLMRKPSNRKLRLVDEFLMVLMRLRLGLLLNDLEFRFKFSAG